MTSSLAQQLVDKGFGSKMQFNKIQTKNKSEEGKIFGLQKKQVTSTTYDTLNFDRLRCCEKVSKFKIVARGLLITDITNIHEIVDVVHCSFVNRPKSQKMLIWLFLIIRNGLKKIKPEYYKVFLNRHLTKTKPKTEINSNWLK